MDIVELISRYITLKKHGKNYKALCPFHSEKTPSFVVTPARQTYHCFGCGAHGTAIGFLMEYDHMSFVEAIESLAQTMGVDVPRSESDKPARRYDELFSLMDTVARLASDDRDVVRRLEPVERRFFSPLAHRRVGGLVLADQTGKIIRGVGLGRGWRDLDHLGSRSFWKPNELTEPSNTTMANPIMMAVIRNRKEIQGVPQRGEILSPAATTKPPRPD